MNSPLELVIHPDKRLRSHTATVETFDDALRQRTAAMLDTMYHAKGIGLAAPQVGFLQRIVVMDVPDFRHYEDEEPATEDSTKLIMINPEIIAFADELTVWQEGCLSLPGQYAEVKRPRYIRYAYQDLDGNRHEADAEGLLCVCIQHEIDHLNGVLFIDHLSRLKRERIEQKLAKSLREKAK